MSSLYAHAQVGRQQPRTMYKVIVHTVGGIPLLEIACKNYTDAIKAFEDHQGFGKVRLYQLTVSPTPKKVATTTGGWRWQETSWLSDSEEEDVIEDEDKQDDDVQFHADPI